MKRRRIQLATTQPPELVEAIDLAVSLGFAKNRTELVEDALREYFRELLLAIDLRKRADEQLKELGDNPPAYALYQVLGDLLKEEATKLSQPAHFLEKISRLLEANPEALENFRQKLKEVV